MSKNSKWVGFVLGLLVVFPAAVRAEDNAAWQRLPRAPQRRMSASEPWIRPSKFEVFTLDHAALRGTLSGMPLESTARRGAKDAGGEMALPMPDGTLARFRVVESPIMDPELAAKFPEIKTYAGQGIDDPAATVRFDVTPAGFHAQVLSPNGAVYIDPYSRGETNIYQSYYKRDYYRATNGFKCLVPGNEDSATNDAPGATAQKVALRSSGGTLRTYRLACAADYEYVTYQSYPNAANVTAGLAAVVTAINRVDGIYESELAVRMVLVANNNLIIFTNSATSPYTDDDGATMLDQNQTTIDSVIGTANYDVGHVFSTGGGGISGLGVVCVAGQKARSVTGSPVPIGDGFYVDYVAHEMGHEFGANHTFNSTTGSCGGGNRNANTAYEVGSGSTIMAYAGICGGDDLQPHSDPYFHAISFDEIEAYITGPGNSCAVQSSTGNGIPTVSAGVAHVIPKGTPFILTATGSDPNGDVLTYCWEEMDKGGAQAVTAADNGTSPIFRSFNPTTNSSRIFPKLSDILNNTTNVGEKYPAVSRSMKFRVTVRDNKPGGGGVNIADVTNTVASAAGPFTVTAPAASVVWSGTQTVTWNVASTASSPVNCANVNILLSTDGGLTFPTVLLANTPNDGSQAVTLPEIFTSQARIKVEGAGNIFFNISPGNFTVNPSVPTPFLVTNGLSVVAESCSPANNAIDPNELVTVNFSIKNNGTGPTTNLTATLLAVGGVANPGSAQNFGAIPANGGSVSKPFVFAAQGTCRGTATAVLQLQDGAASLGYLTNQFILGPSPYRAFTNAAAVAIPVSGAGSPYPSTINVSGITNTVTKVTASLLGFAHTYPSDVEVLLVGPLGQTVLLVNFSGEGDPVSGVNLTFDDAANAYLPFDSQIVSGTYLPTDNAGGQTDFTSPAPAGPYGDALSVFNGINPNGAWKLYTFDYASPDSGSIANGWVLNFTLATSCASCAVNHAPALTAIPDRTVHEGSLVTFTNSATDTDIPAQLLTFSLDPGAPAGASVNASSGVFTWTPTVAQLGTNAITVRVTDNGSPTLSDAKSFNVAVVSRPKVSNTVVSGGGVTLTWTAIAGKVYRVQSAPEVTGPWTNLPGDVTAAGITATKVDASAIGPRKFYRILLVQ